MKSGDIYEDEGDTGLVLNSDCAELISGIWMGASLSSSDGREMNYYTVNSDVVRVKELLRHIH